MNQTQNTNLIIETFKYFDKDNHGIININHLSNKFLHLGEKMTKQQLNEILFDIDYDQDGYVTFKDFIQMTNQLKQIDKPHQSILLKIKLSKTRRRNTSY